MRIRFDASPEGSDGSPGSAPVGLLIMTRGMFVDASDDRPADLRRSHAKQPAAQSKLLPGALALGADVVCVAEEPGPRSRLAVAL
jgi:hypothetical protein